LLLEPCPVLAGGTYAGLEDYGGAAVANFVQVHLAAFAYVDEFGGVEEAALVASFA
jgi:hypothetical protein